MCLFALWTMSWRRITPPVLEYIPAMKAGGRFYIDFFMCCSKGAIDVLQVLINLFFTNVYFLGNFTYIHL